MVAEEFMPICLSIIILTMQLFAIFFFIAVKSYCCFLSNQVDNIYFRQYSVTYKSSKLETSLLVGISISILTILSLVSYAALAIVVVDDIKNKTNQQSKFNLSTITQDGIQNLFTLFKFYCKNRADRSFVKFPK